MDTDGDRVADFAERFLTLTGSYSGQPFDVLPWARAWLRDLYEKDADGRRKTATALLGVPRKNAKSTLAAVVALYQLVVDRQDEAPEVVVAAGDREQARIIFRMAAQMIGASPELSRLLKVQTKQILHPGRHGRLIVVSADAGLAHGLNPSTAIVDEYHVHRTADLYVALRSGMAMRRAPLTLVITTAGWDLDGPLGKLYQLGRKIEAGEVDDPSFLFRWWGLREGEKVDILDPAVWARCNPSYELMRPEEFLTAARQMPESEFIRYRLNGWTSSEEAWLPAGAWDACADHGRRIEAGDEVILGFDGSFAGDATAIVAVRLSDMHVELKALWERPTGLEGQSWRVPVLEVEDRIRELHDELLVREVVADPWFFQQSMQTLEDEGMTIVEFPTNGTRMIPVTKTMRDLILDRGLSHDGNPALGRHIANARLKHDARGSRMTKDYKGSTRYIDAAVASVLAVGRAALHRDAPAPADPVVYLPA